MSREWWLFVCPICGEQEVGDEGGTLRCAGGFAGKDSRHRAVKMDLVRVREVTDGG